MLRQVVVDDQHVAAGFHEVLGDGGRGVRRDVRQARRVVALGDDDHGVSRAHALSAQNRHHLGDRRGTLADRAVHAHHIAATLVDDRVDRDRGLAGLAVAEDQLALAAADRDQRVDHLQAGLQRHVDRRAVHDRRRRTLDRQAPFAD